MNQRFLSVVAFALVVSGLACFVLYRMLSSKLSATARAATSQIVVASHDLQVGALVKDIDIKKIDWNGAPPKGAIVKEEEALGRGVVATVYEGEPVVDSRLANRGAGAGLAATIPPGMRAVAVRVNEVVGVAGFVTPGMRVDLIIAGTPPNQRDSGLGTLSKTLLQNIEVLSAGTNIQKDSEGKPIPVQVVNLLVTPEQAEILSLASNETRIQLVLRNPLDTQVATTPGTTVANLFSGSNAPLPISKPVVAVKPRPAIIKPKPVATPVAAPPERVIIPITIEVLHGSKRAEAKFQEEVKNPEAKN